jgi:hypothetical protein
MTIRDPDWLRGQRVTDCVSAFAAYGRTSQVDSHAALGISSRSAPPCGGRCAKRAPLRLLTDSLSSARRKRATPLKSQLQPTTSVLADPWERRLRRPAPGRHRSDLAWPSRTSDRQLATREPHLFQRCVVRERLPQVNDEGKTRTMVQDSVKRPARLVPGSEPGIPAKGAHRTESAKGSSDAGIRIVSGRFSKWLMARDFWLQVLCCQSLAVAGLFSRVFWGAQESTVGLETFWRRLCGAKPSRRQPCGTSLRIAVTP